MRINDTTVKQSLVAKRLRIRHAYDKVTIKCDRTRQWFTLWLLTFGLSALLIYVFKLAGSNTSIVYMLVATVVGVTDTVIIMVYLAWGWRLVLDVSRGECVYKRTYAGIPCLTKRVTFDDGPIGPCHAQTVLTKSNETPASVIGFLLLLLLGPIGLIIGFLIGLGRSAPSRTSQIVHLPAIFHYNVHTDGSTVLLVLQKPNDRDRVLEALAEHAPEVVSVR